jgi:hypothetical protein
VLDGIGIGIDYFGIGIDKFDVELELTKWNWVELELELEMELMKTQLWLSGWSRFGSNCYQPKYGRDQIVSTEDEVNALNVYWEFTKCDMIWLNVFLPCMEYLAPFHMKRWVVEELDHLY